MCGHQLPPFLVLFECVSDTNFGGHSFPGLESTQAPFIILEAIVVIGQIAPLQSSQMLFQNWSARCRRLPAPMLTQFHYNRSVMRYFVISRYVLFIFICFTMIFATARVNSTTLRTNFNASAFAEYLGQSEESHLREIIPW